MDSLTLLFIVFWAVILGFLIIKYLVRILNTEEKLLEQELELNKTLDAENQDK